MSWRLLIAALLFASPAAADVVDEEVDHAQCASGRALVVDHGQYECLEPPSSSSGAGSCAVASRDAATPWGLLGGAIVAFGLRRRRR